MNPAPTLQLLGTPSAHDGHKALRFTDRKGLALLALLAVDGPTPRSRLADLLWDESDSDIRRNLRRTLHRLREAGFEALLDADGELLAMREEVVVDLREARRWSDADREPPEQPPLLLAGLEPSGAFGAWLMAQRDRWAQAWRQAAEQQVSRWQAAGQPRRALRWARALVLADKLQEGHCVRAMTLHAELGEREAALAVFEQCRKALARELGLRPLATTQALAEQLRRGADAPPPPPGADTLAATAVPPALPDAAACLPGSMPLVGRAEELQALQTALAAGQLVLLRAPAGSGKTRLVQALAEALPARLRVHECRPGDRRVPYAALVRWLRGLAPAGAGAALPTWVRAELARLLPELGSSAPDTGSPAQRLRLFEAVREAWQRWQAADTLPVFDDWHFVDDASAEWWLWWRGQPVPEGATRAVLVCQRPGDETSPGAAGLLAQALAEAPSQLLELASLGEAPVLELLSRLSGVPRPVRFAKRLWSATGGLPLYLVETLRHLLQTQLIQLDEQGRWRTPFDNQTQDYAELPVAPSVQAALMQRLQALDETTRRLLDAACVADDDFDLGLLAAASALDEQQAVPALEQAARARVLVRSSSREGHWRFEHEVFAQALQAALLPERRRLLHRAWAQRLASSGATAARVAAHFEAADDRPAAITWHQRALALANERQARAAQHWHAERLLALGVDGPALVQAWLALAWARLVQADAAAAEAALTQAQAALQPGHDAALRVELLCRQAQLSVWRAQADQPMAMLADAEADASLDPEARARLKLARGNCLSALGRYADAEGPVREALALLGPEPGRRQADALDDLARVLLRTGRLDEGQRVAREAVLAARAADVPAIEASALVAMGVACLIRGQYGDAIEELAQARVVASREGLVASERAAILNLVPALLALGRRREALDAVDEGHALSRQFTGPSEEQAFLEARYQCRVDTGQLGEAYALAEPLLSLTARGVDAHRRASALSAVIDLPLTLGDTATAAPTVAALLQTEPGALGEMDGMAQAKGAWLHLLLGELDTAGRLLDEAEAVLTDRPESQAYRVALRSLWLARRGDEPAARQHREQLRREGCPTEVWALALSLVLAVPGPAEAWEAAAEKALEGDQPPPLGALLLHDALLGRQGPARWAMPARTGAEALHASLATQPAARACFERRFAASLSARARKP
jgi:DNA-binding SARP family transcriptional activator/tetratricopeptide (TPR) repeat protein/energy-coupling factor transporter ATP-binding protein EcfA2